MWKPEGDMDRFLLDPGNIIVHTNDTLECRDCKYRFQIVGSCEKFPDRKPEEVLDNEAPCVFYEKGTKK